MVKRRFAVCCFYWHTAKIRFAVCLCFSTRQTFRHTAIKGFPVVNRIDIGYIMSKE